MWEEQTPFPHVSPKLVQNLQQKISALYKKANLIKQVSSETYSLSGGKVLFLSKQRTNYLAFVRAIFSKRATWACGWDRKMKVFQTFSKKAGFPLGSYFLNQVKQHRLSLENSGEDRNLTERAEVQQQIKLQELGQCFLKFCKPIPVLSVWVNGLQQAHDTAGAQSTIVDLRARDT